MAAKALDIAVEIVADDEKNIHPLRLYIGPV